MIPDSELFQREHRLARYYLAKLRIVDEAMRRGQANVSYGLAVFDQEWEQIRHWQVWTTQREAGESLRARLCVEFPLAGLEMLANRSNAADHMTWLHDGLEAAQQLNDNESQRILCYELMMMYYRLGALETGKHFASQLLALGEETHDLLCTERAFFGLAVYSEERGMYSEAEQRYQQVLLLSRELGAPAEIGRALNALGGVAEYVGEFETSYQYHSQYLELMEIHGQQNRVCHALVSLGESLISLKAYAEAEQYLQRAVHMCRTLGFQRLLGVGLLNLGALALEEDKLDLAQRYLREGLEAVRVVGVQRQIVFGLTKLGYVGLRLGDVAEALAHLHEGMEMARGVGNPRYICGIHLALAHAHLAVKDFGAARKALREALTIVSHLDSPSQKALILSGVVAYFQCLGQHEQAARWAELLMDEPLMAGSAFTSVCSQPEVAPGRDGYRKALTAVGERSLDEGVSEALAILA